MTDPPRARPDGEERNPVSIHTCIERIVGLTAGGIEELADEVGVSYATLYGWATNRRSPTREHLLALARIADRRSLALKDAADRLRRAGGGEGDEPGSRDGGD